MFTIGEQEKIIDERGPGRVDPLTVPKVGQYSAAVRVGRMMEIRGPNSSVNSACASGGDAIGQAMNLLRLGQADCMLAGGSESMISRVPIASLGGLGALTHDLEPRAGARRRGRSTPSAPASCWARAPRCSVLETEEFARARGAPILAELAGAAWSFDATDDAAPDVDGQALAMTPRAQERGSGARRRRLHQRPRHLDAAQRQDGDGGDQAGLRRARLPARHQQHEVDDRPPRGGRRRGRGRDRRADAP